MDNLQKQFKKGVLEIIVLSLLNQGDAYGYEIISQLDNRSNGYYQMKEGSLYPVLYRLEDRGLIESYRQALSNDRSVPRKYYRVTPLGKKALDLMLEEWQAFQTITNQILNQGGC